MVASPTYRLTFAGDLPGEARMKDEAKYLSALKEALLEMDYGCMNQAAQAAMAAGVDPLRAITEGMTPAMALIGEKFQRGEYFLPELIVAADVMREGLKIINPHLKGKDSKVGKRVVIATVEGDNHDIGKDIVATLLSAHGFEVIDLGVDVSAKKIVEAVKEYQPEILGLSALLTLTMVKMGEVISALEKEGLRDHLKLIVGGTSVTPEFAKRIGADYSTTNAVDGLEKCIAWVSPGKGR
jgi:corrinoid protein of di/trimethylamine methyltransferase